MKHRNRLFALVLAAAMLLALAACGQQTGQQEQSPSQGQEQQETPDLDDTASPSGETPAGEESGAQEGPAGPETPEEEGTRILVAYFSATGNTRAVAESIADTLGADLFEMTPADPYTDADLNWTDESSRVVYEHDHPDDRHVELTADTVDNWAEYDTVFIGYPIWWGIAAWPVDTFVEANDFTGKTVIPFATSSSSGLGESGELLAGLAGTGDWLEGMRFRSGASDADVADWAASLGLN